MPAISILVDGEPIATANTEGLSVLSAHVQGSRSDEEIASVDLHGTTSADSTFLIWIGGLTLHAGQQVEARFLEVGETAPPGKTIEELFPARPDDQEPDDEPSEALHAYTLDELESRATPRDRVREYIHAPRTVTLRISA